MDWKNIKTIFIFTFLILNIYLGTEFYNKLHPNYVLLNEEIQKKDIKYNKDLPKIENKQLFLISGTAKVFSDEDVEKFITKNSNQKITVESADKKVINATLKDPIKITTDSKEAQGQLEYFIEDYIPGAEHYKYWKRDGERNLYLFTQQQNETPFYFGKSITENDLTGMIEIYTDGESKGKIVGYRMTQMVLKKEDKVSKEIKADEALLAPEITPGTKLKDMKLVYYTEINNEGFKVFVPSWHIVTENNEWMVDVTNSSVVKLDQNEESEVE